MMRCGILPSVTACKWKQIASMWMPSTNSVPGSRTGQAWAARWRVAISLIAQRLTSAPDVGVAGEHGARDVPGDTHDHLVARARFREFGDQGVPVNRSERPTTLALSRTFVHTAVALSA